MIHHIRPQTAILNTTLLIWIITLIVNYKSLLMHSTQKIFLSKCKNQYNLLKAWITIILIQICITAKVFMNARLVLLFKALILINKTLIYYIKKMYRVLQPHQCINSKIIITITIILINNKIGTFKQLKKKKIICMILILNSYKILI